MPDLDARVVNALVDDLDIDTAEAVEWLLYEAGHDHDAVHRILATDNSIIIARWGDTTDQRVCDLVRQAETGTLLAGMTGPYSDDHDLTVGEVNAIVKTNPYAYLEAAAVLFLELSA
jgi:hypothetical protein